MGLTPRQPDLLNFIRAGIAKTGRSPHVHEMMDHQGTRSVSVIQRRLKALEARGLIEWGGSVWGWRIPE